MKNIKGIAVDMPAVNLDRRFSNVDKNQNYGEALFRILFSLFFIAVI